jgi:hypothetical protein
MVDSTQMPAVYSPFQGIASMFDAAPGGQSSTNPNAPPNMIAALLQKILGNQQNQPMSSYEGGVASPANPYNSTASGGMFGLPGATGAPSAPSPPSLSGQTTAQPDQWGAGAQPVPHLNMSALFGQPPPA